MSKHREKEMPPQLASLLKDKKSSFFSSLKLRNKWEELLLTWVIFIVLDYVFVFPVEWVVFAIYSLTVIYRAFITKATLFLVFMAAAVMADVGATFTLSPTQVPIMTNIVVFGYLVGAIVGLNSSSLVFWFLFCFNDLFVREIPASNYTMPLALYCLSFGSLMSAYAGLVKIANHVHKEKDKGKEGDVSPPAVASTITSTGSPSGKGSQVSPVSETAGHHTKKHSEHDTKDHAQTSGTKDLKVSAMSSEDYAASAEITVPELDTTADVISKLIQSLKKEQEGRKFIEGENKKRNAEAARQIKVLKAELNALKDSSSSLEVEHKKLLETTKQLTDEKAKFTKEATKLEDQVKQLTKEGKRLETLKNRSEETLKQITALKPQQDILKEEQEKREKLERELETVTEELAEERKRTKKIDSESTVMGSTIKRLEAELAKTVQRAEKQAGELKDLREDHTEVEDIRQQLARAIDELQEKNRSIISLTQTVGHLQEKAQGFEATLHEETHFKMELMRELSRSRRELESLYALLGQMPSGSK